MIDAAERCFGSSQTVQELHQCLRQTGERMLKLKSEVIQEVERRVPGAWEGDAAQAFREHMDRQMDQVVRIADGAFKAADGLRVLEVGLAEAKLEFQRAELEARVHRLYIDPTLHVWPLNWADETSVSQVGRVQAMVDAAKAKAERARDDARRRLEYWNETLMGIFNSVLGSAPFGPPGIGGRAARGRRPAGGARPAPPARTLREPTVGSTDGGPGQWREVNRGPRGMEWQEQATGVARTREYEVNGVKFDSYENGKLIDGKNSVYGDLLGGRPQFMEQSVGDQLAAEAGRQLRAAPGTPIEWRTPDAFSAGWIENVLRDRGVPMGAGPGQINVIHFTP